MENPYESNGIRSAGYTNDDSIVGFHGLYLFMILNTPKGSLSNHNRNYIFWPE